MCLCMHESAANMRQRQCMYARRIVSSTAPHADRAAAHGHICATSWVAFVICLSLNLVSNCWCMRCRASSALPLMHRPGGAAAQSGIA